MNKTLKKVLVVLLAVVLLFTFVQPAFAASAGDITNSIGGHNGNTPTEATNLASTIVNYLWIASIIIAVIVLMIIGIKFIIGSTQEKAEYKKSLIPVVVGVVLVVFATTIVNFLFGMK